MTKIQKSIVTALLQGYFLMKTSPRSYTLYDSKCSPVIRRMQVCRQIRDVLKKDKRKRLTINLSLVRQLHGKCTIKQEYIKSRKRNVG